MRPDLDMLDFGYGAGRLAKFAIPYAASVSCTGVAVRGVATNIDLMATVAG